jgi:hypothetical protein
MPATYRKLIRSPDRSLAGPWRCAVARNDRTVLRRPSDPYWERIAAARIHAQSFAKVLAEHTALTFDEVENTLREADKIRRNAQMGRYGAPGSVNTALRRMRTSPSGP